MKRKYSVRRGLVHIKGVIDGFFVHKGDGRVILHVLDDTYHRRDKD